MSSLELCTSSSTTCPADGMIDVESLVQRITALELENARLRSKLSNSSEFTNGESTESALRQIGSEMQPCNNSEQSDTGISLAPCHMPHESQSRKESMPFVVALLDGTKTKLRNCDVKQGYQGGLETAKRLHQSLVYCLTKRKVFENRWKLIIKFYACMSGLGTAYIKNGIIDSLTVWRDFIDGFNSADEFCCFVDVNGDSAAVAGRIRYQVEVCFGRTNCQHTVLVGCGNNQYGGFLRQYERNDTIYGQLTTIEAVPFPGEFKELVAKFQPKQKDRLFGSKGCVSFGEHNAVHELPDIDISASSLFTSIISELEAQTLSEPLGTIPPPSPAKKVHSAARLRRSPSSRVQPVGPFQFLNQSRLIKRKPLVTVQSRTFQPQAHKTKSAFFNSSGQRIDSNSYAYMYTERYLRC